MKKTLVFILLLLALLTVGVFAEDDTEGLWSAVYYDTATNGTRFQVTAVDAVSDCTNLMDFNIVGFDGTHYDGTNVDTFTDVSYAFIDTAITMYFGDTLTFSIETNGVTVRAGKPNAIYVYVTNEVGGVDINGKQLADKYAKYIIPFDNNDLDGTYSVTLNADFVNKASSNKNFNPNSVQKILDGITAHDVVTLDSVKIFFAGSVGGSYVSSYNLAPGATTEEAYIHLYDIGYSSPYAAIPEPTSLALSAMGLVGLVAYRRKIRK